MIHRRKCVVCSQINSIEIETLSQFSQIELDQQYKCSLCEGNGCSKNVTPPLRRQVYKKGGLFL